MVVAKRQRREKACENKTKEGPRTRVRPSGKANSPPGQPNLHRAGSGRGGKTYKKSQNWAYSLSSLRVFWVSLPSCLEYIFPFACQIKLSCSTGPSVASNFCCSKTEPRKLRTPTTCNLKKFTTLLPICRQNYFNMVHFILTNT